MEVFEAEPAPDKEPDAGEDARAASAPPADASGKAAAKPSDSAAQPAPAQPSEPAAQPPAAQPPAPAQPAPAASPAVSLANTAYETDRPPVPPGASTTDTLIGQRIDHFEIRAQLGQGGMGTVYLAHDLSLERPVAIKVLRRELARSPDLVGRLVLEARAQARLQHPNVVNVYYIGQFEGAPYLAMEYVRGQTLADRLLSHGPLSWEQALEYIIQTTRALMEGKHRGIVHRDVKPSNLLVGKMGPKTAATDHIKVADFGLAATTEMKDEHFVGSPYYASPEQIAGKPPDHRSDVYSLGVTFHELLTGAPPFEAESLRALIKLHEDAPRPLIPAAQAPWRLRQLITEMMDPDPEKRPRTYEDLLVRLEALRPREVIAGGVVARGMAQLVDLGVFAVFGHLLGLLLTLSMQAAYEITFALFGLYTVLGHRQWGQTLGKRLFRLRIQGTNRAVTVPRLALRFLLKFWGPLVAMLMVHLGLDLTVGSADVRTVKEHVNRLLGWGEIPFLDTNVEDLVRLFWGPNLGLAIPWMAGFLFAFFDPNRRALHDLIAHTRVVYSMRKELHPNARTD
jgi:eukaryotic-like serine/threonine-protein kinase